MLCAPGVPVVLDLRVPSGTVRLKAESYSLSLGDGSARLVRPKLFDPQGQLLASAETVSVDGLKLLYGANQVLNVRASELYARLTRQRNGRFQLQDLLPARKESKTHIPFQVDVHNAHVDVVDEEGEHPFQLSCRTQTVRVAGLGDDWSSSARLTIDHVGQVSATAEHTSSDGMWIRVLGQNLDLGAFARHLLTTKDLKNVRALSDLSLSSLSASADGGVVVSPRGRVEFEAVTSMSSSGGLACCVSSKSRSKAQSPTATGSLTPKTMVNVCGRPPAQ